MVNDTKRIGTRRSRTNATPHSRASGANGWNQNQAEKFNKNIIFKHLNDKI